jgi:hypothetical protein
VVFVQCWQNPANATGLMGLGRKPALLAETVLLIGGCVTKLSQSVLFFADVFHPIDDLAIALFLDGDVRHARRRGAPMPVLLAGSNPDHITEPDLLDRSACALNPTPASNDDESLAERMRMPRGSRSRLEGYTGTLNTRRVGCLK